MKKFTLFLALMLTLSTYAKVTFSDDGATLNITGFNDMTPEEKNALNNLDLSNVTKVNISAGSMDWECWNKISGKFTPTVTTVDMTGTSQEFWSAISSNFKELFKGLKKITFPAINPIPENILANKTSLEEIVIPDGVKSIGRGAFQGCTNLSTIKWGTTVEIIEEAAFERTGISGTFTVPTSVKEIKKDAFKECSQITDVIIPEDAALEHIYEGAFLMDTPGTTAGGNLKNVYVNANKEIICDKGAFGYANTDGQTAAGTVTTRLHYPPAFYEHYVGSYKTSILGGMFETQEQRLANRNYARATTEVWIDGKSYKNTTYPDGNGWWEFLSTGIPVPYNKDWPVDYNNYWRTYSDNVPLIVPEGFNELDPFNSTGEVARQAKGINVYLVSGKTADGKAQLVRMKTGDVIPANTGVVIHWRAKITDTAGGFIFFAPALSNMPDYGNNPYDNESYPDNLYKGYKNYMKPLNTRGGKQTVQNVEKENGVAKYRNFFWGNSEEFEQAGNDKYKGSDFGSAGVEGWGFYRAVSGSYKINNKAFLHFPAAVYDQSQGAGAGEDHNTSASANAFGFVIVGDDATGISNVDVKPITDDNYYTLQGVKVNNPTERGVYIHKGKKIILK